MADFVMPYPPPPDVPEPWASMGGRATGRSRVPAPPETEQPTSQPQGLEQVISTVNQIRELARSLQTSLRVHFPAGEPVLGVILAAADALANDLQQTGPGRQRGATRRAPEMPTAGAAGAPPAGLPR